MVYRVVPIAERAAAVRDYADAILVSSLMAVGLGKAAFYRQLAMDATAA